MIKEKCPYVDKCGACHMGKMSYEEELIEKKKQVEKQKGTILKVIFVRGAMK